MRPILAFQNLAFSVFLWFSFVILLAGCSALGQQRSISPEEIDLIRGAEGALPRRFQLHDVPHNPRKQKGTDCAPDSLRMVLNYRGKGVKEGDITRQISGRGRNGGTHLRQMQRIAVETYSLPAFAVDNCDLYSLKAAVLNRWPPIIGYRSSGRGSHAVVVVGYNDKRRMLLVHDPNYIRVREIRYYDLGGRLGDSSQRLSCLLVLPEGSGAEDLRRGLERYIPEDMVSKLRIFPMFPSRN
jgi:hypothetical protein